MKLLRFLVLSTIPVILLFAVRVSDLRKQEIAGYQAEIARLQQEIETQDLVIAERDGQIAELEGILNIRRNTYLAAINGDGMSIPANSPSGFVAADYEKAYAKMGGNLCAIAPAIEQAEQEYGINGLVLAAKAVHESGNGTSPIATVKNNLFGLGAYDRDPWRHAFTFTAPEESVFFAANLLSREYLNREGRYYHGENLQAINVRYATDPLWAAKVGRIMGHVARLAIDEPEALLSYAPRGVTRVFGNSIDIEIARRYMPDAHFIVTDDLDPYQLPLQEGDIVVGGPGAVGGVPQAFPAVRLAGEDRAGTEEAIAIFAANRTEFPCVGSQVSKYVKIP